ncbi:MAG: hypothetical protein H6703_15000 [Myxococcales bacterium]|nr:hypothetical protein [Myxococcales bacterium]
MKTLALLLIALLAAAAHAEPLCVAPDERVPFSDGEVLACAGEVPPLTVVREQPVYDRARGEWRQAVLFRFAQPAPWEAVVSGAVRLRGVTLADEPAADAEALRLGDQLWAVAPPGHYEDPGDCSAAGAIIAPHPRRGIEAGEDLLRVDPSGERIRFELAAAGELDDFRLVLVSPDPATAARVDVEIYPALTTPGVEVQVGSPDLDVAPDDGRYGVDAPIPLRLREGDIIIPEACVAGRLDSDRFLFDLVVPADSARLDDRNGALSPMPALGAPVALRWRVFRVESPPGPPLEVVGLDGLDYGLCLDGDEVLPLEALLAAPAGMAEGVHFVRISVWDDRDGDRGFDGIEPGDTVRLAVVVGPDVDGDPCLLRPARPEDDGGVVDLDAGVEDDGGVEDGGADAGDAEADGGDGPLLVGDFGGDGGAAGGGDGGAGDGGAGGAGQRGRRGARRDGGRAQTATAASARMRDSTATAASTVTGARAPMRTRPRRRLRRWQLRGGFGDGGFGDGGFGDGGVGGDAAPTSTTASGPTVASGSDGGLDGDSAAATRAERDDSGSADGGSGDAGLADGPATDALRPQDGAPTDGATPTPAPRHRRRPLDAAPADRPDARRRSPTRPRRRRAR